MRNIPPSILALSLFFSCSSPWLYAEKETKEGSNSQKNENQKQQLTAIFSSKFEPFTGKITKPKVRLRLQANYEGPVLREMSPGEYVVVLGEGEDFYAIQPPNDFRGYVFRAYVLDNVVEADRVNVRLKPDRDATIVSQLKAGERIDGAPAVTNNKWLEITLPSQTRFYIAKEYIDRVGDVSFKDRLDKKREAAYHLLSTTDVMSKAEVQKPFDQMSITGIKANYQHIINDYTDFPEAVAKAKESLAAIQEGYTTKKLAYLEEQSRLSFTTTEANKKLSAELQAQKSKVSHLEQQIEQGRQLAAVAQPIVEIPYGTKKPSQIPMNMSMWLPAEEKLFRAWSQQTGRHNPQEFYEDQKQHGFMLRGIVDPYTRSVKNMPGDYMLLNPTSKLPVAFLYSTHLNLQDYVGHEISILVSPRNNYHFAFPAYFVLTITE